MIYDVFGQMQGNAYDFNGDLLTSVLDVDGNTIWTDDTPVPDYSDYSYTQKWASKGISYTQGFDIYDDVVYWVSKNGNDTSDNKMYVFNLSDGSQNLESAYITAYGGHGNNVTFSDQFHSDSDTLPMVLMSTAYSSPAYLNRIDNNYIATIEKKYAMPVIEGIINGGFDICYGDTNDVAFTVSVFGSNSDASLGTHICIAKWDMTDLTDNGDGTYTPAFISSVNSAWHYWKQGIKYHDGLIWLASGYPGYNAYVYGINPVTGEVMYTIDCDTTTEIEGAVWYPDAETVGGYALYVGFQGMMMRKYTFGELT